jgi:hypothetical protein
MKTVRYLQLLTDEYPELLKQLTPQLLFYTFHIFTTKKSI